MKSGQPEYQKCESIDQSHLQPTQYGVTFDLYFRKYEISHFTRILSPHHSLHSKSVFLSVSHITWPGSTNLMGYL